ncbi:NAD-dependent epimerase/dehydratase family protein [Microbacterium sp. Au-Mic1]|nr:NAD-dependent epimerase/dehydratase family protein [Microbacterium sp. Au-Mic1]MCE4027174.1 NAD-dependent epimerase/dehydratase family protein [Microbacterium sp. Au-Mic1]
MTWLVTGSEGKLGRVLVRHLDAAGIPCRTFDRSPGERPDHRTGDVADPHDASEALSGVEGVIHLAALPSDSAGTPAEILRTNALGTIALADRALKAGCERFVYASSINALGVTGPGRPDDLPIDARQRAHPVTPYQISKRLAEEYLLYLHRATPLEVVILRPPYIADAGDYTTWHAPDFIGLPRSASELFAYVDLDDCARAFVLAAVGSGAGPGPYFLSAEDTCSEEPTRRLLDCWTGAVREDFDASLDSNEHRSLLDFTPTAAALSWWPTTSWRAASTAPFDHAVQRRTEYNDVT